MLAVLHPSRLPGVAIAALVVASLLLLLPAIQPITVLPISVRIPDMIVGTGGATTSEGVYSDDEAEALVHTAISAGLPAVDTALAYGNQAGVGRGLKGVPRGQIFVQTKVPGCVRYAGAPGRPRELARAEFCAADTRRNIETDLRLLGLTYIDLVLLHAPPQPPANVSDACDVSNCALIREQWSAMESAQRDGLIRAAGVSNYCPACLDCLRGSALPVAINQVLLHVGLGMPSAAAEFAARNVRLQSYSSLGARPLELLGEPLLERMAAVHGRTVFQIALRWLHQHGVSIVVKSASEAHLREDGAILGWALTATEMRELDAWRSTRPFQSLRVIGEVQGYSCW